MNLSELIENISVHNEDKAIKVVQWLLDNGDLHYTDDEKLSIVK